MSFWSVGILYLAPNLGALLEDKPAETGTETGTVETGTAAVTDPDARADNAAAPAAKVETVRGGCKRMLLSMCNPLMGAVLLGLLIGLVQPLQDLFFSDQAPLRFVSSAVETLGKPAIGVVTILMSASLGAFWDKYWKLRAAVSTAARAEARVAKSELTAVNTAAAAASDGGAGAAGAAGAVLEQHFVLARTPSYTDAATDTMDAAMDAATSTTSAGAGDGVAALTAGGGGGSTAGGGGSTPAVDVDAGHVPFQSMITLAVVRTVGVLPPNTTTTAAAAAAPTTTTTTTTDGQNQAQVKNTGRRVDREVFGAPEHDRHRDADQRRDVDMRHCQQVLRHVRRHEKRRGRHPRRRVGRVTVCPGTWEGEAITASGCQRQSAYNPHGY